MSRFELETSSLPRKRSTPELHRLFDAANLNLFYRFSTLRIIKILVSFNQINCLTQKNIYAPNCQSIFNQQSSHYISIPNFYSLNLITKKAFFKLTPWSKIKNYNIRSLIFDSV